MKPKNPILVRSRHEAIEVARELDYKIQKFDASHEATVVDTGRMTELNDLIFDLGQKLEVVAAGREFEKPYCFVRAEHQRKARDNDTTATATTAAAPADRQAKVLAMMAQAKERGRIALANERGPAPVAKAVVTRSSDESTLDAACKAFGEQEVFALVDLKGDTAAAAHFGPLLANGRTPGAYKARVQSLIDSGKSKAEAVTTAAQENPEGHRYLVRSGDVANLFGIDKVQAAIRAQLSAPATKAPAPKPTIPHAAPQGPLDRVRAIFRAQIQNA